MATLYRNRRSLILIAFFILVWGFIERNGSIPSFFFSSAEVIGNGYYDRPGNTFIPKANTVDDLEFEIKNGNAIVTGLRDSAYFYTTNLYIPQTVMIDSLIYNVTSIEPGAFDNCSLTSVSMPQVKTIGDHAFDYCKALTSVTIPQVTTIENYAFRYCKSLTSVTMPKTSCRFNSSSFCQYHIYDNTPWDPSDHGIKSF